MTVQTTLETMKGVRLVLPEPKLSLRVLELSIIRDLIDSLLAEMPEQGVVDDTPEERVLVNLYSARLHIVRAIKEAA